MLVYERTIRDRNPEIRAAGKQIPRGPGARECLLHSRGDQPPTPERVRRFRGVTWPEAGQMRVLHSQRGADRTETEEEGGGIRHGVQTKDSLAARDLVNPLLKTRYQQMVLDQQESVYNSKRKAPLGSSHNQSPGLPQSVNSQTTFGLTTVKDESASSIVSPPKSQPEIEDEYQKGRELYRKSHNAWEVGEMVDRDYDWSKFTKESLYGVPTPHDNSGSQVRDALHWLHEAQSAKKAQIVTKRMDNFRERTQPQLGKVHDPIAETLDVDKDHSFGVMVTPDELNAGELMQMEGPSTYLQCQGFNPGVLASIRHHLQKNNFYNFDSLMHALEHHDKEGAGQVSPEVVRQLCFQFDLPLTPDMLELLMVWCGEGEGVRYREMVQLVNWKTQPSQELLHKISEQNAHTDENPPGNKETRGTLPPPPSASLSNYRTCSQMIQATVGAIPTQNYRSYGVPTIRSELPAPRIRRVGDHTNYGDESDAYGLIYPSVYSNRGVYEEDFFSARNPEEVRQIFERIGVSMNPETFQELWREAARQDPKGLVSVESFRAILEEVQAKQMEKQQTSC